MNNNRIFLAGCLSAWFLLFNSHVNAQSTTPPDLKEAQQAIEENNLAYCNAFYKQDADLFDSLYTLDCWIMTPGTSVFCGPGAAREYFVYAIENTGIRNAKLMTINVYGISSDVVAEVGFYQLSDAGNKIFDDGKYIVLWKKTGKTWKRFRDSFSSSRTPRCL